MIAKFGRIVVAAIVIVGASALLYRVAQGAAADAMAPPTPDTVAANPQNDMSGWTMPTPANMPADPMQAARIKRGEYLVVAGDCLPCHSVPGQPPFSGGLAVGSPVGAVFSPNITSDPTYGIGSYTDDQFYNVLHNGIAPGSSMLIFPKYLYPSMPYDAYSKLSRDDVLAIKAYLMSLPPAAVPNRPSQIPFPFNIRAALLGWRILFFSPQPIQYDPSWSPQVRNGAFLVQALEHCSDCHTPRNLLFASETDKWLAGGHILAQSWYAPNISSSKDVGVGGWQQSDLVQYLHGGGAMGVGAAVGPMQEVVGDSLSRLPESDVQDIAAYLQTGTGPQPSAEPGAADPASTALGHQVYDANCARCHGGDGEGVANNFPNLANNQAFWDGPPYDLISMILGGFAPWHDGQSNMPAFRGTLTDAQIAAVSNYVRTSWGNKGAADATADMVGMLRPLAASDITLSPGSAQATLQTPNGATSLTDISGDFSRDGNQLNCQIDGTFGDIQLAGTCTNMGTGLHATATINGQSTPVNLTVQADQNGVTLFGPIGANRFTAHISYITPNE